MQEHGVPCEGDTKGLSSGGWKMPLSVPLPPAAKPQARNDAILVGLLQHPILLQGQRADTAPRPSRLLAFH